MSYHSHYPILAAAVARTTGPILELGAGEGSTPLLHYTGREVLTVDTDASWLETFAGYRSRMHAFEIVGPVGDDALPMVTRMIAGWNAWRIPNRPWSVAFIDCAPGEARHELAIRLAEKATYVVCHDSETDYQSGGNYMYDRCTEHFLHVTEWRRWRPYTLVLSNYEKFEIEPCDQSWSPPS